MPLSWSCKDLNSAVDVTDERSKSPYVICGHYVCGLASLSEFTVVLVGVTGFESLAREAAVCDRVTTALTSHGIGCDLNQMSLKSTPSGNSWIKPQRSLSLMKSVCRWSSTIVQPAEITTEVGGVIWFRNNWLWGHTFQQSDFTSVLIAWWRHRRLK